MVKLKGPALSMQAAGSLAKTVVFSSNKGRHYLKRRAVPSDPRSGSQLSSRVLLGWLNDQWSTLTADQRDSWSDLAQAAGVSPYHSFLGENMNRWHTFATPSKAYPAAQENRAGTIHWATFQGYDGILSFSYDIRYSRTYDEWGCLLFLKSNEPDPPTRDQLIHIPLLVDRETRTYHVTDVTAGTYWIQPIAFGDDGTIYDACPARQVIVSTA